MIRLTELRLPIDHSLEELETAICKRLSISLEDLIRYEVFKRSYDARKNVALSFIYTLDFSVKNEEAILQRFAHDLHIRLSPDTRYHFVAHFDHQTKPRSALRPVVIGFGPCGIFAALTLAQMGLKPIVLERGKTQTQSASDLCAKAAGFIYLDEQLSIDLASSSLRPLLSSNNTANPIQEWLPKSIHALILNKGLYQSTG